MRKISRILKNIYQSDYWFSWVLFLVGLLSRLPLQAKYLFHWDGVQFALGIQKFNPYVHQPHFPGYPLLVGLGKVINLVLADPAQTLVWISTVSSALSIVVIFHLGYKMFNRAVGTWSALIFLTSPLMWFYGEIDLGYAQGIFWVLLVVLVFYLSIKAGGSWRNLILAAILFSVAGGFRPDILVFLAPLWLYVLWRVNKQRWLKFFLVNGILLVLVAAWFIPLIYLTGGWAKYAEGFRFMRAFQDSFSIFTGAKLAAFAGVRFMAKANFSHIVRYFFATLYLGSLLIFIYLIWAANQLSAEAIFDKYIVNRTKVLFLLLWIVPDFIFNIVIVIINPGNAFVYLGAFVLLSGLALAWFWGILWPRGKLKLLVVLALLIIFGFNLLMFFRPLKAITRKIDSLEYSWGTINSHDKEIKARLAAIKDNFSPEDTYLIAPQEHYLYNIRHIQYYLPQYNAYQLYQDRFIPQPKDKHVWHIYEGKLEFIESVPVADNFNYVLFIEPGATIYNYGVAQDEPRAKSVKMENGEALYYIEKKK